MRKLTSKLFLALFCFSILAAVSAQERPTEGTPLWQALISLPSSDSNSDPQAPQARH